uniref:Retrovirus-related Pol polyprotein from transposon TNT 1-94 n=1 Tax=Tanacetum cinerariifolium TaxID=118510 RepID=A0A699IHJ5_TANCI|nr:retrovirus-related Pol polyprotein from transposon TNT 1-94 [Tanacetum cinerariifolium]
MGVLHSIPYRSHTSTRHKGKEIAKPITLPSEIASEEDSDPKQAQRDKDMEKNLALIAKTVNVAGTREKVGSHVVQKTGIQCFNSKEYGHFSKECRKPKRVKDSAYHKEKMLLYKQAEQGVPLQAEQYDWLADTDEEVDEQELEAHYSYMAKIQEVPNADLGIDSEPVKQVQNKTGYNVFANELQHFEQSEYVSNTCLVEVDDSNVTPNSPDMCEDDIQNDQMMKKVMMSKANTTLAQELKDCKAILVETSKSLRESISVRDSCLVALQTKQTEFGKYKAFNDRTIDYDKLERKLNDALGQLAHKDTVIREGLKTKAYELSVVKEKHDELMKQSLLTKLHYEGLVKQKTKVITDMKLREEHDIEKIISMEKQLKFLNEAVYKRSQSIQTIHMMAPKVSTYNGRPTFANPRYLKQAQSEFSCLYAFPYDQNIHANRLIPDGEETLALKKESRSKLIKDSSDSLKFVHELKQEMHADLMYVESLEKEIDELEYEKAEFSDMYDVILQDCVSKDVMCSYLQSLSYLDALAELQCMYLHKGKERVKNDTVCNEKASNGFRKRHEQYIKIQDLKAKLQDKNIAISELKKLIEKGKGKSVDTKFDRPSAVRQPNAQRIPKPSVLGKPIPFSNSLNRIYFQKTRLVSKANVSEGLSKPVTAQTLPPTAKKAVRVTHKPNVSRPQLKSNQSRDKVMPNNSQVKVKKTQVEVHPRIPSVSNKTMFVTACKDNLNSRTLNANAVCATCNKCLVDSNHFACVTKMLNDVHARTKKPNVVPVSNRKSKIQANKSIATPNKKKVASKYTSQKPQSYFWVLVYYVEGLNHNLFSVGQFCDADLEVAFRKSTCFVRDLQGNDLLIGNRGSDLYTMSFQESTSSTPLCLMAKATPTQAWLWHQRLSHLNFDYINLL